MAEQKVSVIKCQSYGEDEVFSAVKSAVNLLGGIAGFVKPGQKVLLKPNMLGAARPEEGATTHPEVVRAVIKLVKEAGGVPFVGDSPGYEDLFKVAEVCGIKKICDETGVPIVDLKTEREVKNPKAIRFKSFIFAKEVLDADVIINLPKMKMHELTGISGAVKNVLGYVPGLIKSKYHANILKREDFALMLLDLLSTLPPQLSIMDAIIAMDEDVRHGPLHNLGIIAASGNAIALDEVMCEIINVPISVVPTVQAARKYSLITSEIEVLGGQIEAVKFTGFKAVPLLPDIKVYTFLMNLAQKLLIEEKPELIKEKCIGCGICFNVCQSKAIDFSKKSPVFNYGKCIRCFCCEEMCPEGAIRVKHGFLQKFLFGIYIWGVEISKKLLKMV